MSYCPGDRFGSFFSESIDHWDYVFANGFYHLSLKGFLEFHIYNMIKLYSEIFQSVTLFPYNFKHKNKVLH